MPTRDEILRLDSLYVDFPGLEDWPAAPEEERCRALAEELAQFKGALGPDDFRRATQIALRAAAVDTGAIERLYSIDPGLTISVALQMSGWAEDLEKKGPKVPAYFASQLEAYELILDSINEHFPVTEAVIRRLHEVICGSQETYTVLTAVGFQEQALPLGRYKSQPNHLLEDRHKRSFAFAPVDRVGEEMHRLTSIFESAAFKESHPILQAAFAHYSLVRVHPFADGNGRVARALASLFLVRDYSVPLLVFADQRSEYIAALEAADDGRFEPLLDLFVRCTASALDLAIESMKSARARSDVDPVTAIRALYRTPSGLTHGEVDRASYRLFDAVKSTLEETLKSRVQPPELSFKIRVESVKEPSRGRGKLPGTRYPLIDQGRRISVAIQSHAPADANIAAIFVLRILVAEGKAERISLDPESAQKEIRAVEADVQDLHPLVAPALHARIRVWTADLVNVLLAKLASQAAASLRGKGYA